MFELCMSGHALRIFRRSSFAQTMKAFLKMLKNVKMEIKT